MGLPNNYSRDIVIRCESLIRHLLPKIDQGLLDDEGGSSRASRARPSSRILTLMMEGFGSAVVFVLRWSDGVRSAPARPH